ncbi:MAG: DUF362 domain-containing protein [Acidobacteriia bacterium]|nr:DUF362 domain-containing protein [Terriglobia bacterium]
MEPHPGWLMTRRGFLGAAAASGAIAGAGCARRSLAADPPGKSAVAILRASSYREDLADRLARGAALCGLEARGKRVLLKPNLVEFDRNSVIHTQAEVLAAAVTLFERLGASEITIGEGPGHRRDAWFLAEEAGYRAAIPDFDARFVDLNRDEVSRVAPFAGNEGIYLARTALAADLVVSIARMKTHHWAGATLSMKNLFGVVPGALYGWPKNHLHQVGIPDCVAGLYRTFPRSFAIVDGIVGMEGNGPIQGRARPCGVLVMGSDLAAVDATCCRIMGIDPEKIEYLRLASRQGRVREASIEQRGELIPQVRTSFELIPEFRHVRLV